MKIGYYDLEKLHPPFAIAKHLYVEDDMGSTCLRLQGNMIILSCRWLLLASKLNDVFF
jgi:hypothetical protein